MKFTKSLLLKIIREELELAEQQQSSSPFSLLLDILISSADGAPMHVSRLEPEEEELKRDVFKLYQIQGDYVYLTEYGEKVVAALFPEESAKFLKTSDMEKNIIKKARGEPYQPSFTFESRKKR